MSKKTVRVRVFVRQGCVEQVFADNGVRVECAVYDKDSDDSEDRRINRSVETRLKKSAKFECVWP